MEMVRRYRAMGRLCRQLGGVSSGGKLALAQRSSALGRLRG
jgi:hypothetical protein